MNSIHDCLIDLILETEDAVHANPRQYLGKDTVRMLAAKHLYYVTMAQNRETMWKYAKRRLIVTVILGIASLALLVWQHAS